MSEAYNKIHRWCLKTKLAPEKVVAKVALDLMAQVVMISPVKTGRFKTNWMIAEGSPNLSTTEATGGPDMNVALAGKGTVFITNSLPYAARLEYGWSKQAPNGMVRITTAKFLGITAEAVAFVRQSEGIG